MDYQKEGAIQKLLLEKQMRHGGLSTRGLEVLTFRLRDFSERELSLAYRLVKNHVRPDQKSLNEARLVLDSLGLKINIRASWEAYCLNPWLNDSLINWTTQMDNGTYHPKKPSKEDLAHEILPILNSRLTRSQKVEELYQINGVVNSRRDIESALRKWPHCGLTRFIDEIYARL